MPIGEILAIGSELVGGSTLNTNAHFLSQRLSDLNIEVGYHASCRDIQGDILEALDLAWKRSDIIFVVGGLGPTPDDITRDVVALFFKSELAFDAKQYDRIERYFREKGKKAPLITKREACFPRIAKPLLNRFGLALGFYVWRDGKLLISLPGVPKEMMGMFEVSVVNLIREKFPKLAPIHKVEVSILGMYETEIMERLGKSFFKGRDFQFGIYPDVGQVIIRTKTKDRKLAEQLRRDLRRRLGKAIFSEEGEMVTAIIGRILQRQKKTLAVAESCTGGWLAKRLTDIPESSRHFLGGVVAYANPIKEAFLSVPRPILQKYGAVSPQVAKAMAEGVRARFGASLGLGITGIAGPKKEGKKPIGLVYIALADGKRTDVRQWRFAGDRRSVRLASVQRAFGQLWQYLQK